MHSDKLEIRMRTANFLISIILLFLLLSTSNSQDYSITNYTKDRDLVGNQVFKVFQDSKGYMWFCTSAGLIKYNGSDYKVYSELNGFPSNIIFNVEEDDKGRIWVGSTDAVSVIEEERVKSWTFGESSNSYRVFIDNYQRIWVYSIRLPGDVYYFENDSLVNFSQQYRFKDQRMIEVTGDVNGAIYFLNADREIYKFFLNSLTKSNYSGMAAEIRALHFYFNSQGNLILTGNGGVVEVITKDVSKGSLHYKPITKIPSQFSIQNSKNYYWIATKNDGLLRIDKEGSVLQINEKNGLISNALYTLYEDRERSLWIGTYSKGLSKLNNLMFVSYGKKEGFTEDAILTLCPSKEEEIYVGSERGAFLFSDGEFHRLQLLDEDKNDFSNSTFVKIMRSVSGEVNFVTSTGIYTHNNRGTYARIGVHNSVVQTAHQTAQDEILVGTITGLLKVSDNNSVVPINLGLENNFIHVIKDFGSKDLFVGTDSGLVVIDEWAVLKNENKIKFFKESDGLISNKVYDVVISDLADTIIATNRGLTVFPESNQSPYNIIGNNIVNALLIDSDGNLWAGTSKYLYYFSRQADGYNLIATFGQNNGLASNEFTLPGTIFEDSQGNIWFGTVGGLTKFNPNEMPSLNIRPQCYITQIRVNDSTTFIPNDKVYELKPSQNRLSFDVEVLSYLEENDNRMEYYLEPIEKPWSNNSNYQNISYTYLEPGVYTFHVRGVNYLGVRSDEQIAKFEILAPIWQRSWFIILAIIFVLLMIYFWVNYRQAYIRKRNSVLREMVNKKTEELLDSKNKIEEQYNSLMEIQEELVQKEKLETAYKEIEVLKNRLIRENIYLKEKQGGILAISSIIGESKAIIGIKDKIMEIGPTDSTVLLTGETGVGKNLIAEAIHSLSSRKDRSIVTVNCASIPESLVESELFGHEKGSFTGANERRIGKFEVADGSTIFLDEIGDMNLSLQVKLLNVLQSKKFTRVGGNQEITVDTRIIAATNHDLQERVKQGKFRSDLYYRINVIELRVPPLRDREEDIEMLAKYFIDKYARLLNKKITDVSKSALEKLKNYSFPGNIRELENIINRAVILCKESTITDEDIFLQSSDYNSPNTNAVPGRSKLVTLEEVEREYIIEVLQRTDWKISGKNSASDILGLHHNTLRHRMDKLNIPFSRKIQSE